MRIEQVDGVTHVWLRQSWINDAVSCNERGRHAIVRPTWSIASDSSALGTACHKGIETALNGGEDPFRAARVEMERLIEEPMRRTLNMSDGKLIEEADRLTRSWDKTIAPQMSTWGDPLGIEWTFDVEWTTTTIMDRTVVLHLTGTVDYLTDKRVVDWKTSGRKYNVRDKQRNAVQPSVYTAAAVLSGHSRWPADFTYGVMLRGSDDTQLVPVHRNEHHLAFVLRLVRPLIATALGLGLDQPWTLNDTGYLCSEKWCPWFSICKGVDLTSADLSTKEYSN